MKFSVPIHRGEKLSNKLPSVDLTLQLLTQDVYLRAFSQL